MKKNISDCSVWFLDEFTIKLEIGQRSEVMIKNKLTLKELSVKSFVTALYSKAQITIAGGDTTTFTLTRPRTQIIGCDDSIDPFECGQTGREDCSELITNDPDICDDILN